MSALHHRALHLVFHPEATALGHWRRTDPRIGTGRIRMDFDGAGEWDWSAPELRPGEKARGWCRCTLYAVFLLSFVLDRRDWSLGGGPESAWRGRRLRRRLDYWEAGMFQRCSSTWPRSPELTKLRRQTADTVRSTVVRQGECPDGGESQHVEGRLNIERRRSCFVASCQLPVATCQLAKQLWL
jgi:hypothetical protein